MARVVPQRLTIAASLQAVDEIAGWIRGRLPAHEVDVRLWPLIELAVVEAVTNIVRHNPGCTLLGVSVRASADGARIRLADNGAGYDMSARPAQLPVDPLATSGRGLYLIRHCSSRFRYRRVHGRNIHLLEFDPQRLAASLAPG